MAAYSNYKNPDLQFAAISGSPKMVQIIYPVCGIKKKSDATRHVKIFSLIIAYCNLE